MAPYFYYKHVDYNEDKTNSTFFWGLYGCENLYLMTFNLIVIILR